MIKKTIYVQSACHVQIKRRQLVMRNREDGAESSRPVEDIGFLVLDHPQITITMSVVQLLSEHNVGVVFCNQKHHPSSTLFHLEGNNVLSQNYRIQTDTPLPLKKQLWQQTIKAKIKNQAAALAFCGRPDSALRYVAKKVKSGDSSNEEARAARMYWPELFGTGFIRARYGASPNNILNYGYAVLRAAVARALTGTGLLPTLGIHHKNKYNAFCLADDLMEPYRPYVDLAAFELCEAGFRTDELLSEHKKEMLNLLNSDVKIGRKTRPYMIALTETASSFLKCLKKEKKTITYPVL